MKLTPVESSAIAEIGYDNGTLIIRFHSRRKPYLYPNVPEELFREFLCAPSQGKFFHEKIKDKFQPIA